jgi:hypothetical protein
VTHRAELIAAKVAADLIGLDATGENVFRGRPTNRPLPESQLPALFVYLGPDVKQREYSQELIDSVLTINVTAVVKAGAAQIDSLLLAIREQVAIRLQSEYQQALAFVINTDEGDADEPEISGDGDQPVGVMKMAWHFLYRRNRTNPGA